MMQRLAIITLIFLSGCANYTKRALPTEAIDHSSAYLYGRFYIDAPSGVLSLDGQISMGFVIKCDDGSHYNLKFYNASPVFALKLKPANCSLKELIYSDVDGYVMGREAYAGTDLQSFELKANQAYYLGDYTADFSTTLQHRSAIWHWSVKKVVRNYQATTNEMQSTYQALRALPTVDLTAVSDLEKN